MVIKIILNDKQLPPGKVADAELHFTDGPLEGLRLIGFTIWQKRGTEGYNVVFPSRQYAVNGERRSFALLRPTLNDVSGREFDAQLRDLILDAYLHRHD